jgi:aminotransferase
MLDACGFSPVRPAGAYYVMTDIAEPIRRAREKGLHPPDAGAGDVAFAHWLAVEVGVASVPASSFFRPGTTGREGVRFCYCKRDETLAEAGRRLIAAFGEET